VAPVSGVGGAVATGHPSVSEAAVQMLAAGGNAFDAAIAAGFASAVAEPMLTSLGGGGFLLAHSGDREVVFDFFTDTPGLGLPEREREPHFLPVTVRFPSSEQIFNIGLGSVAVPGTLAGLLHVHDRLGRLSLDRIVAPAAGLARDGVELNAHQAYAVELLVPINTLRPEGRALYAPEGRTPRAGDRLANAELADFLETLPAHRARDFYGGDIARRIEADMHEGDGLLTAEDLATYRVVEREPLAVPYRGRRILTNPRPSFGGSLIALSLRLHEGLGPPGGWGGNTHLRHLAAVMVEVEALREATFANEGPLRRGAVETALARVRRASGGTTHISVADGEGNAAALTLSNGEGSGYVVPGTGIMLNNMLGEDDLHPDGFHASPPGQRVSSMMAPTLVLSGGEVVLIVGSGGSKRIRTALVQVITAVVDHGFDVVDAVEAPRLHWDGECLQAEPGFDEAALASLESSWRVNRWPERNLYFGGVHAADPRGQAAGDPRRGGSGIVLDPPSVP
jgi:gamma-glutamyltranspeptidase/glutathione hydrolase